MPPRRSTRASSAVSTAPAASSRSTRSSSRKPPVAQPAPSDDDSTSEEEVVRPKPPARKPPVSRVSRAPVSSRRNTSTASSAASLRVPEQSDDELDIPKSTARPISKGRTPPPPASQRRKTVQSDSEEDLEDFVQAPVKPPSTRSARTSAVPSPGPRAEDEATSAPSQMTIPEEAEESGTQKDEAGRQAAVASASRDSTPDIPASVLPPATPSRGAAPRLTAMPTPAPAPVVGPKPRLTIHKLVLVNFKSYAGRQEIGPFHKSFSAIVGPNGSGKSNTIDALLFVFGYRASKMRQGKLSELIHNSAGKENIESCSVEVWFREIVDLPGVDNFLLVPNSQLVVARSAFRNNSSKYTINDRSSSFTEVTSLLKGKGIDLDHNRFLILQGEVESIALMKPKAQNEHEDGLLEYLEDIIGTTQYKEPIEQASHEVEGLNEERGEKMNRLRVVEREKASLEDKKREAEAYLRDTNELTRKKSLLWQFHMHTLRSNIDITTKAIDALNAELTEEQERNAHHLAEIESLQKGYDEKLNTFNEVKKFADALVKDAKNIEKHEVGLQEKKKHLVGKQKKLKKSMSEDQHTKSEAAATIDNCAEEIEANRAKVEQLEKKLEAEEQELEEVRDSLKDKTDEFTTKIEAKQRELEPWTAKINEKQSAIDVAQSERDLLAQKATGAQEALREAEAALTAIREGDRTKQQEYKQLSKDIAVTKKQLKEAEAKVEEMAASDVKMREKVSTARQKAEEARASLQADRSENNILTSLNKLKAQGRLKGFHGRLGDLGVIDDKYDVAVTTACGALNNLVFDKVEQAEQALAHLRKNNIGRANCYALEQIPDRGVSSIQTPEGVPRLFDLIKPKDAIFTRVFYKALTDTVVANDLAQAQRVAYKQQKRWRVVTLSGELFEPSGTMSGGGKVVRRGGMSSKFKAERVAPETVTLYEQESASVQQRFTTFRAQKAEAEQNAAQLRKRIPEMEMELEKMDLDIQTADKRIAEAQKRLAELESQNQPNVGDEKRIRALDIEIASLSADAAKLREKSGSISEQIKELQNRILEVGGVKLRAIQSKFATTKGLLDMANDAITKAEVGQAKATRDVQKLEKAILANQGRMDEVDHDLGIVEGELAACSQDLAAIRDKVQEAQDASTDVQDQLAESKAALDEASTEVNAFRKLEMDIKQKLEDNARVQKDSKDKYRHWAKRHEELELVYIDEDDEEEEGDEDKAEKLEEKDGDDDGQGDGEEADTPADDEAAPTLKRSKQQDSLELMEYSPDELRAIDKDILNGEITALEEQIAQAKPNLNVLNEYRRREAEFLDRARDMEAVTSARDTAKQRYDDLRKVRLDEFMAGFSAISAKLKEMYQMITMGGNAEIELVDTMDPFSEGVVLSIMPPKKSWRPIANLSGGEKTLASLALVFALHVFKPTPLYFMDEIDAALDFKNVSIVANYIQSKTQAAQFIVISLRNDMFELAHRLVGIYKTSNCTKSIAIDNKDLRTQAVKRQQQVPIAVPLGALPSTPLRRPGQLPVTPSVKGPARRASATLTVPVATPNPFGA